MIITFAALVFIFLFLFPAVQKNVFFMIYGASMILTAYFCETKLSWHVQVFGKYAFMLFLVFHILFINFYTFCAYGVDKRRAQRGQWRIPEVQLHTMELLGGIIGAVMGQKIFHHKNKKKSYLATFWAAVILQFGIVFYILKSLHII